ncbi:alpha/beta fold hydrolase [Frigoribacterium sp. 2-23]|uniref:alpha/beta fold hydrolase n=1 Tax=Frigoribacterium sp. 2-23 TaxID=3415006 RepID=UPI003C6FCCAE
MRRSHASGDGGRTVRRRTTPSAASVEAVDSPDETYAPYGLETRPEALGLTTRTIETSEGRVVVRHAPLGGARRATILLHGAAGSWTTWTPLLRSADEAGTDLARPVLIDLPGWGDSPTPPTPLDVDRAAEVVVEVAEQLGALEFDLVGHSLGGFVALHLAATRPELVTSVSLVSGTTFSAIDAVTHPWRGLVRLPAFTLLRAGFAALPTTAVSIARAATRLGAVRVLAAPIFRHVGRIDPSVLAVFADELRPREFSAAALAGATYATSRWRAISCDVNAVSGADDVFARPDDLDRLSRVIPHTRVTLLADCGHFAHIERPFETLRALGYSA